MLIEKYYNRSVLIEIAYEQPHDLNANTVFNITLKTHIYIHIFHNIECQGLHYTDVNYYDTKAKKRKIKN